MGRPLRAVYANTTYSNGVQEMSNTDILDLSSALVLNYVTANRPLYTILGINDANSSAVSIGSVVDSNQGPVGAAPSYSSTTSTFNVRAGTTSIPSGITRPVQYTIVGDETKIQDISDSDLLTYFFAPIVDYMSTGGQGGYYLGTTSGGPPVTGTWTSVGTVNDTYYVSSTLTTVQYTLWQRTDLASTTGTVRPLKQTVTGTTTKLIEMTDSEIQALGAYIGEYIRTTGIGQYVIQASAPGSGTWVNRGSFVDSVNNTADNGSFVGGYLGVWTGSFTGAYTSTYTGNYAGTYLQSFAGTYTQSFTGAYTGLFTGLYTGAYSGLYTGFYSGLYTGSFVGAYSQLFTGSFVGAYSQLFTGLYTGAYGQAFTGSYAGTYSQAFTGSYVGTYSIVAQNRTYTKTYSGLIDKTYSTVYAGSYGGSPTPYGGPTYTQTLSPSYTGTYNGPSYTLNLSFTGSYVGPGYTKSTPTGYAGSYAGPSYTKTRFGTTPVSYTGIVSSFYTSVTSTPKTFNSAQTFTGPGTPYTGTYTGWVPQTGNSYTATFAGSYAGPSYAGTYISPNAWTQTLVFQGRAQDYQSFAAEYVGYYNASYTGTYNGSSYTPQIQLLYAGTYALATQGYTGTGSFTGIYNLGRNYTLSTPTAYSSLTPATFTGPAYTATFVGSYTSIVTGPTYTLGPNSRTFSALGPSYTATFAGTYTGSVSGPSYTKTFTGIPSWSGTRPFSFTGTYVTTRNVGYTGSYQGNFTGAFAGSYTSAFSGAYAGSYTGAFSGAYTGSYAGTFSGAYAGSYTGTFSGAYAGSYTGAYAGSYQGTFVGAYAESYANTFTGNYNQSFTGTYTLSFTGNYVGNYSKAYAGTYGTAFTGLVYTGVYTGLAVQASTTTNIYTLWVRTA